MKALYFLFLYLGLLSASSTAHATGGFSGHDINPDEPKDEFYSKEFLKYYKNGNLKLRQTVFYTMDGKEYQTIDEAFRKNGTERDCLVMNKSNIIRYTKYNSKGHMKFERNYYYSGGQVESVETRRANGQVRIWTRPPQVYGPVYAKQYCQ